MIPDFSNITVILSDKLGVSPSAIAKQMNRRNPILENLPDTALRVFPSPATCAASMGRAFCQACYDFCLVEGGSLFLLTDSVTGDPSWPAAFSPALRQLDFLPWGVVCLTAPEKPVPSVAVAGTQWMVCTSAHIPRTDNAVIIKRDVASEMGAWIPAMKGKAGLRSADVTHTLLALCLSRLRLFCYYPTDPPLYRQEEGPARMPPD